MVGWDKSRDQSTSLNLPAVPGDLKQVKGAAVRSKGQKPETEQSPAEQRDRLQHVGPDHGLQSSQHGVEESQDAAHNQNGHRVPSRHGVERFGHQEQDHSIPEKVVDHIDHRGVAAGAVTEALFQKFVGAHADPLPVVGNHPAGGQNSDDGENQVGEVGDPVAPEPLARKGQKSPGADGGAEKGESYRPPGDGAPSQEKGFGAVLAARKPAPHEHDQHQVSCQDQPVDSGHGESVSVNDLPE